MMYVWMIIETALLIGAGLLLSKGDTGPAIFTAILGLYSQGCRLEEARKQRGRLGHYGIRMNP